MSITLNGGVQSFVLWDPALYTQLAIGNVSWKRIVGNIHLSQIATTATNVAFYWAVFDTDSTDTTPGALFSDPLTADVDTVEKKNLWGFKMVRIGLVAEDAGTYQTEVDWKAGRRIGGNQTVNFVIKSSVASTVQLVGAQRLLAMY